MKILNLGSLNIDHCYQLPHIVIPGETCPATGYTLNAGGKGLNQAIAIARAGQMVYQAGRIGTDGIFLKKLLQDSGVNTEFLVIDAQCPTGHAIIQVSEQGENAIIIYAGANGAITGSQVAATLEHFDAGDIILLQNEINLMPEIIDWAHQRQLKIFFNPAPMTPQVFNYPLRFVDTILVNEIEGAFLAGFTEHMDDQMIVDQLQEKFPGVNWLMTCGSRGAIYQTALRQERFQVPAAKVHKVWDTTGAGDTFTGYFVAAIARHWAIPRALKIAAQAAGICVSRPGAAPSIPYWRELKQNDLL